MWSGHNRAHREVPIIDHDLEHANHTLSEALAALRRLDSVSEAERLNGTCDLVRRLQAELDRLCGDVARQRGLALQHERDILDAIVENSRAHLAYLDREFRFVRVNAAYARGSGYSVRELIGAKHFDLFPHTENEAIFREVWRTGRAAAFQAKPFVYPDRPELGVTYWDWTLTPDKDERGRVCGLVFSLTDVTDRQRAQDQVRQLARFPGENPNPVLRVLGDGTITYANPASALLLDYWQCTVGQRLPRAWRERVETALRLGAVQEAEVHVGQQTFALSLAPVSEHGYVNVYGHDITARREAQLARDRHANRLWLLHEAGHAILTARSAEEMARAVLRLVPRVIPCERACVLAFDLDAREMSLLAVYAGGEMQPDYTWHGPLEGAWRDIVAELAEGRTYVAPGALAGCPAASPLEQQQAEAISTYVCAPLIVEGQLIGSLNLGLPTAGPVDHEQESFIHGLADELAIGIRQVHLYQAAQSHAAALEQQVLSRTAQLAASEARFRAIFEGAALGIALLDGQGHIVASNPALQAMLGYSADALRGTTLAAFADPEHTSANGSLYLELIEGKRASYAEQRRYLGQDGGSIVANVTLSVVQNAGESAFGDTDHFVIALVEDVTEQKEAQAALIESEKLALIGQLAASLAHEVNNPLQAVVGCLGLAQEVLAEGGDVDRYVNIALEEVERAVRVMRHMQDLSRRPDQDEREPADVADQLERALLLTESRCRDAGVEVEVSLEDDLPSLWVVPEQIQQVFLNLVLNAIDAMPEGGRLRIAAARTTAPAGVEISFSDTGVGIPTSFLPRLYEPFESTKAAGLGLGLYVCRTIVELHDGRIAADSKPGKGTTFTIWLPTG